MNTKGQAIVSAGAAGRTTGAILVNDSVLKYEGFGYDKVMSRTINAINFMLRATWKVPGWRCARPRNTSAWSANGTSARSSQAAARGAPKAPRMDDPTVRATYGRMNDYVKNVRNSFENAFTYYLPARSTWPRGRPA